MLTCHLLLHCSSPTLLPPQELCLPILPMTSICQTQSPLPLFYSVSQQHLSRPAWAAGLCLLFEYWVFLLSPRPGLYIHLSLFFFLTLKGRVTQESVLGPFLVLSFPFMLDSQFIQKGLSFNQAILDSTKQGSPYSSVGKESTCNAGDPGSIPGLGRSPGERIGYPLPYSWASLVAQLVKNLLAIQETWVQSLVWEDPLEKGKATHSSILAWRIPWTV